MTSDFERTARYDEPESRCGVRPDAGWERITPIPPTPAERELLSMRRDGVVPRTTGVDRYRFVSHFIAGHPPAVVASVRY